MDNDDTPRIFLPGSLILVTAAGNTTFYMRMRSAEDLQRKGEKIEKEERRNRSDGVSVVFLNVFSDLLCD